MMHRKCRISINDYTGVLINVAMIVVLALQMGRGSKEARAVLGYICFLAAKLSPYLPVLLGWEERVAR